MEFKPRYRATGETYEMRIFNDDFPIGWKGKSEAVFGMDVAIPTEIVARGHLFNPAQDGSRSW